MCYNPAMSFIEDFRQLLLREPKHFAPRQHTENSDYTSFCYKVKNCYLCFASDYLEDCFYIHHSEHNKDCADGMSVWESELSYECMDTLKFYNCDFCWNSTNLTDCFLCEDCRGCQNCFGCSGLRQKKFCIFNKDFSKEDYFKKTAELKKKFFEDGVWGEEAEAAGNSVMAQFNEIRFSVPHIQWQQIRCENSIVDYSVGCKNCYWGFDLKNCEDCSCLYDCASCKDCSDGFYVHNAQLCYDMMSVDRSFNCDSGFWIIGCKDCVAGYCLNNCENCFGCTNLKHKKFHILNKEYSEKDYFKKKTEIIDELKKEGIYGENLLFLALKDVELGQPWVV